MTSSNQFKETYNLFRGYINYSEEYTYEQWINSPEDHKVAILYCQFYKEITLAWNKVVSVYSQQSDGVDEVIQYLIKNVDKIKQDEKRFRPQYIYTVAYNCLYCLCRDLNKKKKIYENECSNIIVHNDEELDLFETVQGSESTSVEGHLTDSEKDRFWSIIEDMGQDTVIVVSKLLNDPMNWTKTGKARFTKRDYDKISDERFQEILASLKDVLAQFSDILL